MDTLRIILAELISIDSRPYFIYTVTVVWSAYQVDTSAGLVASAIPEFGCGCFLLVTVQTLLFKNINSLRPPAHMKFILLVLIHCFGEVSSVSFLESEATPR